MTADELEILGELFDKKLAALTCKVDKHDRDITAFKAVLGAFVWLGGAILAMFVAVQSYLHK